MLVIVVGGRGDIVYTRRVSAAIGLITCRGVDYDVKITNIYTHMMLIRK